MGEHNVVQFYFFFFSKFYGKKRVQCARKYNVFDIFPIYDKKFTIHTICECVFIVVTVNIKIKKRLVIKILLQNMNDWLRIQN